MLRATLLLFLTLIALGGCKPGQEDIVFPMRPKMYRSFASLSPGASEIAATIATNVPMVGRTAACNYPSFIASGTTAVPIVAQVKPDYEKLKGRKPELVIYDADLYNAQDIGQIKALGIDVFEFKAKTLAEFEKEVRAFAALVGAEMEASTYLDKIVAEEKHAASIAPAEPPTIAMIMPGKGGEHYIAGTGSFQADVIRAAGGKAVGPNQTKFVPIDAETLIQLNPDMVITAGPPDGFVNDPRLKSMSAVAKVKVRGVNQDIATRKGYRVDMLIQLMSRAISNMQEGS